MPTEEEERIAAENAYYRRVALTFFALAALCIIVLPQPFGVYAFGVGLIVWLLTR